MQSWEWCPPLPSHVFLWKPGLHSTLGTSAFIALFKSIMALSFPCALLCTHQRWISWAISCQGNSTMRFPHAPCLAADWVWVSQSTWCHFSISPLCAVGHRGVESLTSNSPLLGAGRMLTLSASASSSRAWGGYLSSFKWLHSFCCGFWSNLHGKSEFTLNTKRNFYPYTDKGKRQREKEKGNSSLLVLLPSSNQS